MNRPIAIFTFIFVILVLAFSTWQLFAGNLEAAFSAFPFLIITYFFVRPWKKDRQEEKQDQPPAAD